MRHSMASELYIVGFLCTQDISFQSELERMDLADYYSVLVAEGYQSLDKVKNFDDLLQIGMKRADARVLYDAASGANSAATATLSAADVQEKKKDEAVVKLYLAKGARGSGRVYCRASTFSIWASSVY